MINQQHLPPLNAILAFSVPTAIILTGLAFLSLYAFSSKECPVRDLENACGLHTS